MTIVVIIIIAVISVVSAQPPSRNKLYRECLWEMTLGDVSETEAEEMCWRRALAKSANAVVVYHWQIPSRIDDDDKDDDDDDDDKDNAVVEDGRGGGADPSFGLGEAQISIDTR